MSQRNSEYARVANEEYLTPEWVVRALLPYLPPAITIWEPAAGKGNIVNVLREAGHTVTGTDRMTGLDFFSVTNVEKKHDAIVTNPPFNVAKEFIEHALVRATIVAMLLRTDYDHAKTRQHLFKHCKAFTKKVVLTKRIMWFPENPKAQPSFNHAWFIWNNDNTELPTMSYFVEGEDSGKIGK
jgi:hypothetical protein